MSENVFRVTGNKISSLLIDRDSLKFLSRGVSTRDAFQKEWDKKLSLATKVEVKFDKIRSIRKEDNDKDIIINYRSRARFTTSCEFAFADHNDYKVFFSFIEDEKKFTRTYRSLTPFRAIRNYLIGLAATVGFTVFFYYQAVEIANGTAEEATDAKTKLFYYIIGWLGYKGVVLTGTAISCYLLYKIRQRFLKPPCQVEFRPPET